MAFVRVEQRNARLASAVKVEFVKGREGEVAKGTVTVRRSSRRARASPAPRKRPRLRRVTGLPRVPNPQRVAGPPRKRTPPLRLATFRSDHSGAGCSAFRPSHPND